MRVNPIHSDARLVAALERFAVVAAALTALAGALVLAGWAFDVVLLKQLVPGQITMKPLTALGLLLGAAALWLLLRAGGGWQRRLALICAGVAALIGGLVLVEYVFGTDLGIDQLLFRKAVVADGALPIGRPAPATALCLLLLGLALLALDARPAWLAPAATLTVLLVTGLALLGYAYEVTTLYQIGPYVPIAPGTALAIVLLALGLLAARPAGPVAGVLTTDLAGSGMGRRLLPAAIVVPFVLGWLRLVGQRLGLYDTGFGVSLLVTGNVVTFAALIYASARLLNQADANREATYAALREREERLRVLADATPNGLIIVADGGDVTWSNARGEALFGYEPGKLLGVRVDELVPAALQGAHAAHRAGFAADRRLRLMAARRDLVARRRDGAEFPVEIGLSPIETSQGKLTLASIVDITERKSAEAALRQSEDRFAKAFRASPAALTVTRLADGRFVDVNDQFLQLLGYQRDEVIGRTSTGLNMFPDPADRAVPVQRLRAEGTLRNLEIELVTKAGERRSVLLSSEEIELGGEAHVLATLLDNTERKRAEEALRRLNAELESRVEQRTAALAANEAKLRALFDVLPVGVSILDRQQHIVQTNPALGRIMKMPAEGLAAGDYDRRQVIRPDGSPMPLQAYASARALDERRPVLNVETGTITETGETIWTYVSAAPLPVEGLVVVTADITERKKTEADLQAANARFQYFVDANIIGVTRSDEHGNMIEANDYYLNLLGYSRRDFEAGLVNWIDRTPPEFLPVEARAIAELKAHGVSAPFEKEYVCRDGSRAWVYLTNALLPDGTIAAFILDITERKHFEAALIEGGQRYRALFEAARRKTQELTLRDMMHQALARELEVPEVLRILVEGIAETVGYTLVSLYLLDGDVLKLEHQVGYQQVIESIPISQGVSGRVVRSGQPVLIEDVHGEPDFLGAIEGISSEICVPLFDQGQVAGVLNVESREEVKLTEADLRMMQALGEQVGFALGRARLAGQVRESQQRFAGAFSFASIGMALVAPDGRWLQVNPALCRLVGYSADELLATTFQAITHPDDLVADLAYLNRVAGGEIDTYQMEKRYIHKLGHLVWILLSVSVVRDAAGQLLYFVSQIQDITERKQAEQALAHERDLLQALMDNIPDTIYFKDAASRFTRINRAQAEYLRLPDPTAAIGKTDLDFQPLAFAQEIYDEEQRLVQTGQLLLNRVDMVQTHDGQTRWMSSTKVPLKEDGRVVGLVGVSRDITALKQAEAQLTASLQEKEVLLKEIHHRVKNNLQIVSSLLHLQAEAVGDPRLREAFDDSQRRVRSMALIHDLLYGSQDLAHIDFGTYVNSLLIYLRRSQARTAGPLPMRVEIENLTLPIDLAIPLGLMVNELVTNSLKYAFPTEVARDGPDEIWVTAARDAAGSLTVVVGDTGAGLPAALDLDHPASMGMQLVQSFVTQLRAKLTVQRRPGTVFTLTIPEGRTARG